MFLGTAKHLRGVFYTILIETSLLYHLELCAEDKGSRLAEVTLLAVQPSSHCAHHSRSLRCPGWELTTFALQRVRESNGGLLTENAEMLQNEDKLLTRLHGIMGGCGEYISDGLYNRN